jgi:hypothetical protein
MVKMKLLLFFIALGGALVSCCPLYEAEEYEPQHGENHPVEVWGGPGVPPYPVEVYRNDQSR